MVRRLLFVPILLASVAIVALLVALGPEPGELARVYFDRNATQNAAKRSGEQPVVEPTRAPRLASPPGGGEAPG